MASIAEANSLFEIDMELGSLLEEIELQIEAEGEPSQELIARFQEFCEARLMLYDFETKAWRSTQAVGVDNPTWSRDGKYIYFDTEQPHPTLSRVRVADGHLEEFVDLRPDPNLAYWWSGATPDGSPIILRNIGSSQIYSLSLEAH